MKSPFLSIILLSIFLILNILDAHSTWLVIKPNHFYREKNIIARYFFRKLGIIPGILIFKTLLLFILGYLIYFYVLPEYLSVNVSILIGDLIFTIVVLNNYRIHRKLTKK